MHRWFSVFYNDFVCEQSCGQFVRLDRKALINLTKRFHPRILSVNVGVRRLRLSQVWDSIGRVYFRIGFSSRWSKRPEKKQSMLSPSFVAQMLFQHRHIWENTSRLFKSTKWRLPTGCLLHAFRSIQLKIPLKAICKTRCLHDGNIPFKCISLVILNFENVPGIVFVRHAVRMKTHQRNENRGKIEPNK